MLPRSSVYCQVACVAWILLAAPAYGDAPHGPVPPTAHSSMEAWRGAVMTIVSLLLLFFCGLCVFARRRAAERRGGEEREPLIDREPFAVRDGTSSCSSRNRGSDVAAIGTPARDFVRLSSLPDALNGDERQRCLACGTLGECVTLRPCGHVALCQACSDFAYTCPHCGQYISGAFLSSQHEGMPSGPGNFARANHV